MQITAPGKRADASVESVESYNTPFNWENRDLTTLKYHETTLVELCRSIL